MKNKKAKVERALFSSSSKDVLAREVCRSYYNFLISGSYMVSRVIY